MLNSDVILTLKFCNKFTNKDDLFLYDVIDMNSLGKNSKTIKLIGKMDEEKKSIQLEKLFTYNNADNCFEEFILTNKKNDDDIDDWQLLNIERVIKKYLIISNNTDENEIIYDTINETLSNINGSYYGVSEDKLFVGLRGYIEVNDEINSQLDKGSKSILYVIYRDVFYLDSPVKIETSIYQEIDEIFENNGAEIWDIKSAIALAFK